MDPLGALLLGLALWLLLSGQGGATIPVSSGYSGDYSGGYGGDYGGGTMDGSDIDTLARTIYGEARGESYEGQQGVANVVMNRFYAGNFGGTVGEVCKRPWQFSCWNANDPNLAVIQNVTASDATFRQCQNIAREAVAGSLPDVTRGALYYYDNSIQQPKNWTLSHITKTVQIGRLIFGKPWGIA